MRQRRKHHWKSRNIDLLSIDYPPLMRGLALGPTNPGSSFVAQETLGLRWERFSRSFLLLMPAFSLPCTPRRLTPYASTQQGTLPYRPTQKRWSLSFGTRLSPVIFSAQGSLTSELLRFL